MVHGLTTAASVWLSAAIGVAAGGGLYFVGTFSLVIMVSGVEGTVVGGRGLGGGGAEGGESARTHSIPFGGRRERCHGRLNGHSLLSIQVLLLRFGPRLTEATTGPNPTGKRRI